MTIVNPGSEARQRGVRTRIGSRILDEDRIVTLSPTDYATAVDQVSRCVATGGIIAIPTDTVYGLACSLDDPIAIREIFEIKRRPLDKPLPVLLSAADHLHRIASISDPRIIEFASRYWPGPLTVVVDARPHVPSGIMGSGQTVAVRVPGLPLARDVIERSGGCLAATSANRSGLAPARSAAEVVDQLGRAVDLVLDNGSIGNRVASSVVAFSDDDLIILREGSIAARALQFTWDHVIGECSSD